MFENLDDPFAPDPAPIDAVAARGRRLQTRRRALVSGGIAVVAVSAIAIGAAMMQRSPSHHVVIAADTTSTTTSPNATSSSVPDTTTVPNSGTTPVTATTVPGVLPGSGTTTPHDPHDYSQLTVQYGDRLGIRPGVTRDITYTVTNNGSWLVTWSSRPCGFELWGSPPSQPIWGPYPTIWPQPYPSRLTGQAPCRAAAAMLYTLQPGETRTFTERVVAGYPNLQGDVFPAPPGYTSFQPPFVPQCAQPCSYNQPDSLPVTIYPPDPPPVAIYRLAIAQPDVTLAAGRSTTVELHYTNVLAFPVRMPLWGPCWSLKAGPARVDCSQNIPAVIVGPHTSIDLTGTIWARAGFTAGGAPLSAGKYSVPIGDSAVTLHVT